VMFALLFAKWTTQPYYAYVGGIVAVGLALLGEFHQARSDLHKGSHLNDEA